MKTSRSIVNSRREKILETVRNDGDVSVSSLSEMRKYREKTAESFGRSGLQNMRPVWWRMETAFF